MAGPGQSRGKGKALESIAARSGRDPAAIIDSIQAAEKAQAKAEAAKQRAAKVEASKKKAAAAKAASKKNSVGVGKGLNNNNNKHENTDDDEDATKDHNEVNYPSQIYSSLSPQEQYRFQCYRRSGFASKPIEKFVAKMLVDEANRRFVARRGTLVGLGGRSQVNSGSSANNGYTTINGEDEATAATVTDTSDLDHHHVHSNHKKRKKPSKRQMLQEESKRRRVAMDQPPPYLLNSFNNGTGSSSGSAGSSGLNSSSTARGGVVVPPLDQLVVPNSASEIVAVVSTLAKCYAQRLVSAARRVADVEQEQEQLLTEAATKATVRATTAQQPILPQHLLEAHRYRGRAGLDPGFWMADRVVDGRNRNKSSTSLQHASVGTSEAAALGTEDRTRSCFLAAIAAQDAYDAARTKEDVKKT